MALDICYSVATYVPPPDVVAMFNLRDPNQSIQEHELYLFLHDGFNPENDFPELVSVEKYLVADSSDPHPQANNGQSSKNKDNAILDSVLGSDDECTPLRALP